MSIKYKISFFSFLVVLMLNLSVIAQQEHSSKKFSSNTYWTKSVLAIDGDCKIKVAPDDISPDEKVCYFYKHLLIGSQVTLQMLKMESPWAKLTFIDDKSKEAFVIYVKNTSKKTFKDAFDLFFSKREIKDSFDSCDIGTKLDVIKKIGFPSRFSRSDKGESWHFDVAYVGGQICGYDASTIEIGNRKVTSAL